MTTEGRLVAVTLMVAGIALLGVVTAAIATWFVESLQRVESEVEESGERTCERLEEVLAELRAVTERLTQLEGRTHTENGP